MLSWYQSTNFSSLPTLLFLLSMTTTIINTNDHHSTLITINVAAQTPVKLTSTNYLAWKLQFQTLFIGYDLHGFIDGSHPCPASLLPDTTTPNPAYTLWIRQDQLLLNAILGSLSPTIMSFIAQAQTSKEAWTILANTYAKPSRGRIKQVKNQLKHITKGSMGVSEFLQTIKARADELATLGAPVDAEDLSDRILEGLGDDYKELTRAVQARDNPISFDELMKISLTLKHPSNMSATLINLTFLHLLISPIVTLLAIVSHHPLYILPGTTDWDILLSLFYNMSFLNMVLIYLLPVYPSCLVMLVIAIRVTNFHFLLPPLLPLDHFISFSPMYGLHQLYLMMVLSIMSSLLIISLSIYGSIL